MIKTYSDLVAWGYVLVWLITAIIIHIEVGDFGAFVYNLGMTFLFAIIVSFKFFNRRFREFLGKKIKPKS